MAKATELLLLRKFLESLLPLSPSTTPSASPSPLPFPIFLFSLLCCVFYGKHFNSSAWMTLVNDTLIKLNIILLHVEPAPPCLPPCQPLPCLESVDILEARRLLKQTLQLRLNWHFWLTMATLAWPCTAATKQQSWQPSSSEWNAFWSAQRQVE